VFVIEWSATLTLNRDSDPISSSNAVQFAFGGFFCIRAEGIHNSFLKGQDRLSVAGMGIRLV
jgi:hypothetical protein